MRRLNNSELAALDQWVKEFVFLPRQFEIYDQATYAGTLDRYQETYDLGTVAMMVAFDDLVQRHGFRARHVLNPNGLGTGDKSLRFLRYDRLSLLDYDPALPETDLHHFRTDLTDIDFIFLGNTLEHVYNPVLCLENLARPLVSGGLLYTTVPCLSINHPSPYHFALGFTPIGLASLLVQAGLQLVEIGQWGNLDYATTMLKTRHWPGLGNIEGAPDERERIFRAYFANNPNYSLNVWALARKP